MHQDFKHFYTPWIHLLTYRLRHHLAPVFDIPGAESTVFRTVRAPSQAECREACRWRRLDCEAEIDRAFAYCSGAVAPRLPAQPPGRQSHGLLPFGRRHRGRWGRGVDA